MVVLQGRPHPAYDAGKRIGHLFNYGGESGMMQKTFWLSDDFARMIYGKLADKYTGVMEWRKKLGDGLYGVGSYTCPRCQGTADYYGPCGRCSRPKMAVMRKWSAWSVQPSRVLTTPFMRRRLFLGRRKDGEKAAAAQKPQSTGISMWYRTLQRLKGFVTARGERVEQPVPRAPYRVVAGTYDSFLTECRYGDIEVISAFQAAMMERCWPALGGKRFPAEAEWGLNWRDMEDIEREAFAGWEV